MQCARLGGFAVLGGFALLGGFAGLGSFALGGFANGNLISRSFFSEAPVPAKCGGPGLRAFARLALGGWLERGIRERVIRRCVARVIGGCSLGCVGRGACCALLCCVESCVEVLLCAGPHFQLAAESA